MRKLPLHLVISILFTATIFPQLKTMNSNLMPFPYKIFSLEGKFKLEKDFNIIVKGEPDERIYHEASRFLRRLSNRTGLFFPQDYVTKESQIDKPSMIIDCLRAGKLELKEEEAYTLLIMPDKIELKAITDLGAMHGFETLLQLLSTDEGGYFFPSLNIVDKPRFPWRGLMIDACRHFMPVDVIKRNLDAMAAVKMNVFHWHLSEDQGFRVESKIFPQLHELGSDGLYYTQEEIKDVINYAGKRGIRVIPEFDVPGHSTAWFVAFPELASAPGPYQIERNWGIFDPCFNPANEAVYEFLDKFFGEMAALFPDEYFHIGGDEVNGKHWNANEQIQTFMKQKDIKDNHQLQAYFNKRILEILTKHGKKMIGWDEILHPDMPNNIVIQSWRGHKALVESAQKGYMGILSNGYYIDLIQPAEFHYLNDPIPANSPLSEDEMKFILGGEATSWAELVTYETVDSRIWPRTAAIAERLWSTPDIDNVDEMYRRLENINYQLEEHGLLHIKNYEMMLRRLTNNNDISALKILVDVIEPVKIYNRHFQGVKYTSYSPYTRIVDAARPESMTARNFRILTNKYLEGNNETATPQLISWLTLWRDNHECIKETMLLSPVIREIDSLSQNLAELSELGLETISMIEENKNPGTDWFNKANAIINKAKKPYGQCEIMIVSAVEKLAAKLK
jgi:hexosaminidase